MLSLSYEHFYEELICFGKCFTVCRFCYDDFSPYQINCLRIYWSWKQISEMKMMEIGVIFGIMILGFSVNRGYAEVYIVTMEDEPVISYRGGVNGFEATAVESDEKIDVTR